MVEIFTFFFSVFLILMGHVGTAGALVKAEWHHQPNQFLALQPY